MELTQRWLVNRRVRTADGEILTKYVFLFWDREWKVILTLLDRFGAPPAILPGPVHPDGKGHVATPIRHTDVRSLAEVEPGTFSGLYHFDPWRVFRGIGGVDDPMKQAVQATNIARPFKLEKHHWKVHDVDFEFSGERVRAIIAKDEIFQRRDFTPEELDLEATWPRA